MAKREAIVKKLPIVETLGWVYLINLLTFFFWRNIYNI
jgi:hypothetical protein